jgi:hypothetical protein
MELGQHRRDGAGRNRPLAELNPATNSRASRFPNFSGIRPLEAIQF